MISLTIRIKEIDPKVNISKKAKLLSLRLTPKGSSIGAHAVHTRPSTSTNPSVSQMMRVAFHTKIILTINVLSRCQYRFLLKKMKRNIFFFYLLP